MFCLPVIISCSVYDHPHPIDDDQAGIVSWGIGCGSDSPFVFITFIVIVVFFPPVVVSFFHHPHHDQAGIVSWGIGCGSDSPAVYAKVAKASCWIDYEVKNKDKQKDRGEDKDKGEDKIKEKDKCMPGLPRPVAGLTMR